MKLNREEAIANHRKMWNWIADETERIKRSVDKTEYFIANGIRPNERPAHLCYCCQYDVQQYHLPMCAACPIDWGCYEISACDYPNAAYYKWKENARIGSKEWRIAAYYARAIANLPERESQNESYA